MNPFVIFFPHLLFVAGAALLAIVLTPLIVIAGGVLAILMFTDWKSKNHTVEHRSILGMDRHGMTSVLTLLIAVLAFAGYSLFFVSCCSPWQRARPTKGWQDRAAKVDTAIVLGFGIGRDSQGRPAAGRANRFLYGWALKNTAARTLLVQEGIRLAAMEIERETGQPAGRQLVMIHPHDEKRYIDTLEACGLALARMTELGRSRAVLVAHDLQLRRAYWDILKARRARAEWRRIEVIVPRIPKTPFPGDSRHWHTRGRLRYKFVELFWSRPRDYLASSKKFQ